MNPMPISGFLGLSLLLGYLIGSVPSAALAARLRHQDIFAVGSSNMGAMNTARNLGWALGALVLLLDLGKGALASAVGWQLGLWSGDTLYTPLIAGVGAVIGHLWSVWVGFRGGKGLATTLGVALPLYPLGGLCALLVLLITIALTRRSRLASLLTAATYPVWVYLALFEALPPVRLWTTLAAGLIGLLVVLKHLLPTQPVRRPRREA
jgi:glycerol-3-phosphate acyltransferase PlsY